MNTLEYKKFQIVKAYCKNYIGKKTAHLWERDLDKAVEHLGQTGMVLANLLKKEIKEHNSKIYATGTRIDNLKYKNHKSYQSSLIKGNNIPYKKIDALLKDNPDKDWYDLYIQLID
ncbi:hypothetical protein [Nonlabens sp.]|jgi:hypothetical protein|uniref:hypothetical protein n=1 Tax=Nonlabens sp. TaxID=1888209 RepID=UPI0039E37CAA